MPKKERAVEEELNVYSVTIMADGMADIMYTRKIVDKKNRELVVSDVVRETVPQADLPGLLDFLGKPVPDFNRERLLGHE